MCGYHRESAEELKSLLMKVKEESKKVGLKLKVQKTKIMASSPITSWQIDGETVETVADFILLGSKVTAVVSDSVQPHRRQPTRLRRPWDSPGKNTRLIIIFLSRSKRLVISWLQSPSAVILEPPKIKSATVSTVSPSISHEVMGLDAMIFVF